MNVALAIVNSLSLKQLLVRIPKEEQMMLDAFGAEYKQYQQRTRKLFPFVW